MLSLQSISVPFKEVWSNDIKLLRINPHWTVEQFMWSVKPVLQQLYHLENYDIDIVPINQIHCLLHNIIPELAPALEESNSIIRHIWGRRLDIMFYVRRRNYFYPEFAELNISIDYCIVCTNTEPIRCHYSCEHKICEKCYCKLIQINNRCPTCRRTGTPRLH